MESRVQSLFQFLMSIPGAIMPGLQRLQSVPLSLNKNAKFSFELGGVWK